MSYVFFMDESGHDLHNAPYEVRGGIVINAANLWKFTLDIQKLEISCFGDKSCRPKIELKGTKLLKTKIFKNAKLDVPPEDIQRRTIEFLNLGDLSPKNYQFAAYSRSCLKMVEELFKLFQRHNVYVFASMIPREKAKVSKEEKKYLTENGILRKDLVFLWQRYFYFLREHDTNGLLILDETEGTIAIIPRAIAPININLVSALPEPNTIFVLVEARPHLLHSAKLAFNLSSLSCFDKLLSFTAVFSTILFSIFILDSFLSCFIISSIPSKEDAGLLKNELINTTFHF